MHNGLIATGDKFISDKVVIKKLSEQIDGLMAVEMEGASVAQVAYQENIPGYLLQLFLIMPMKMHLILLRNLLKSIILSRGI